MYSFYLFFSFVARTLLWKEHFQSSVTTAKQPLDNVANGHKGYFTAAFDSTHRFRHAGNMYLMISMCKNK